MNNLKITSKCILGGGKFFNKHTVLLILLISIVYLPTLLVNYLSMDDFWLYKSGVNNTWIATHARFLGAAIYNIFFKKDLPYYYLFLRIVFYMLTILFSLLLYCIFQYINNRPRLNLFIVTLTMCNVVLLISTAWLSLAPHLISSICAIIIFFLILRSGNNHEKYTIAIAILLTIICLSIYQTSIFFTLGPFTYFLIIQYISGQSNNIRCVGTKLIGVLLSGGLVYFIINFIYFKLFNLKPESRLHDSLNIFSIQGIIKRFHDSNLSLSAYYYGFFNNREIATLYFFINIGIFIGLFILLWRKQSKIIYKVEVFLYYILAYFMVLVPALLQGFGDLRSKMVYTMFITISILLLFFHKSPRVINNSRITSRLISILLYFGLAAYILSTFKTMSSFILPYSIEMSYMEQLLNNGTEKSKIIIVVKTKDYPSNESYYFTVPYLGHEPSIKLNSQYMVYNGGIYQMVEYILKKQGKNPNEYEIKEIDYEEYQLLKKSLSVNSLIIVDMNLYESNVKQYVLKNQTKLLKNNWNPFYSYKDFLFNFNNRELKEENETLTIPYYDFENSMLFNSLNNTSKKYQLFGWSQPEDWGTWTDGRVAELIFSTDDNNFKKNGFIVDVTVEHVVVKEADIYVNNKLITKYNFSLGENKIYIPALYGVDSSQIIISIRFQDDIRSPKELGINSDTRKLGIGVKEVKLLSNMQ